MAQGNIPGYGLDRREVTQGVEGQAPRGQKVEAATVPLSPVMSPRPSSFAQAGKSQAMMAEALKWGGQYLGELVERENRKNLLEGQALYAQGKGLDDLKKEGVPAYTEHGWRMMDAQTAAATWSAAVLSKVDETDHQLNPDQFRTKMTSMLADYTKGKDEESVNMIMATAMKHMPEIIETQIKKNAVYRETQTMRAGVDNVANAKSVMDTSGADTGKADWMALLTHQDSPLTKLPPPKYNEVVVSGIEKAYEQDNPNAHAWAKEAGVLDKTTPGEGLTAAQLTRIRQAEQGYYGRKEQQFNADYTARKFQLIENVRDGKISFIDALEEDRKLQEANGLKYTAKDANAFVSTAHQVSAEARAERRADVRAAKAEQRALDREAELEARQRAQADALAQYDIKGMALDDKLRRGELGSQEYLDQKRALADAEGLKWSTSIARGVTSDIVSAKVERDKKLAEETVIQNAVGRADLSGLKPELVQKAITFADRQIQQKYTDKVARSEMTQEQAQEGARTEFLDFWSRAGHVDHRIRTQLTDQLVNGSVLDSTGNVPSHKAALFDNFMRMYQKNPELALQHVEGERARSIMLGYVNAYQAGNPNAATIALRDGDGLRRMTDEDMTRARDAVKDATSLGWVGVTEGLLGRKNTLDKTVNDYLENVRPGVFALAFDKLRGNDTVSMRRDVRDGLNEEALGRAGNQLRGLLAQEATTALANGATRDPAVAVKQAWIGVKDRVAIVGDSAIVLPKGQNFGEKMFGPGVRASEWDAHDGLMAVIKTTGNSLWGKDIVYPGHSDLEYKSRFGTEQKADIVDTSKWFGGWDSHKVITRPAADGVFVRLELGSEKLGTDKTTDWKYVTWKQMGDALKLERSKK